MNNQHLTALLESQQQIIEKIALGYDLKKCLTFICEEIESIINSPLVKSSILILDGNKLRHGAAPKIPKAYCDAIDGVEIGPSVGSCGTAVFTKKQVIVSDIEHDPLWKDFKDFALGHDLRACWSTPILSSKVNVLGSFAIYYPQIKSPDDFHLELINRFTALASLAIEKKQDEQAKKVAEEKEQKALAIKSEFLANMSHEIRTPMNGILGMVELLNDTELSKTQKKMVRTISSCGDGLMTILNDILDLNKIESGNITLELISFNLIEAVNEILYLNSYNRNQKDIEITTTYSELLPKYLIGDVTRIKQVLVNYISNAIKFTDSGGKVNVDVQASSKDGDIYTIVFSVSDTGIGISKENQAKLFQTFSQADSTITRKYGGTGLGLAICSKLVKLMSGSIELISEVDKGSTFSFTLNLKKSLVQNDTKLNTDNNQINVKSEHNILVVDDNEVNQTIVTVMLKKLGYNCDVASNGIECLAAIEDNIKTPYSIIFMDIQMPLLDGMETTRQLINKYPTNHPVIVPMTANVFKEDRDNYRDIGMQDFLSKPLKTSDLSRILNKY